MPTARMEAIIRSTSTLVQFANRWDPLRQQPEVCDFAFGNPHEMAIPNRQSSVPRPTPSFGAEFCEPFSGRGSTPSGPTPRPVRP